MLRFGHCKTFGRLAGGLLLCLSGFAVPANAADAQISFAKDVKPILQENCVECHRPGGQGFLANGLDLTSYDGVMKGTRIGPVVIPGDVFTSNLLRAVLGQVNTKVRMPFHRTELADRDSTTLLRWIYQGAKNN